MGRKCSGRTEVSAPKSEMALRAAGFAAALLAAGRAGAAPLSVELRFDSAAVAQANGNPAGPRGPRCSIRLGEVQDLRADKLSLGALGGRAIRADGAAAWVGEGLKASIGSDSRLNLVDGSASGAAPLALEASLLKAYVLTSPDAKDAVVVLKVRFVRADGTADEAIYRGNDNSVFWGVGGGEVIPAMNSALSRAITQIVPDALSRCR